MPFYRVVLRDAQGLTRAVTVQAESLAEAAATPGATSVGVGLIEEYSPREHMMQNLMQYLSWGHVCIVQDLHAYLQRVAATAPVGSTTKEHQNGLELEVFMPLGVSAQTWLNDLHETELYLTYRVQFVNKYQDRESVILTGRRQPVSGTMLGTIQSM